MKDAIQCHEYKCHQPRSPTDEPAREVVVIVEDERKVRSEGVRPTRYVALAQISRVLGQSGSAVARAALVAN